MLKKLFFKHLVYTNSNIKKILIIVIVNILGVSSVVGIPVVAILDLLFLYYNIDRILKKQGGFKFLFKLSNFLWLLIGAGVCFFMVKSMF